MPLGLSKRDPAYTDNAKKHTVNGNVEISLNIDVSGNPEDIQVIGPRGFGLDENAVKAVKKPG